MSSNKKLPPRIANSALARARYHEELEWYRPYDPTLATLPRPIVLVNGAFDLLHAGHMKILFKARAQAGRTGTVIVALDSDRKVGERKPYRPVLSWIERAAALAYMPVSALVEIDTTDDMNSLVDLLKPDLRVQGYDYIEHQSAYPQIPKLFVREGAMRTSEIIRRCQTIPNHEILPTPH